MGITAEQQKIIESKDQYSIILAGAGVGKSLTIIEKVKYLVFWEKIQPEKILLTSFSRVAASELRQKTEESLGKELSDRLHVGTIHSLCYKIVLENLPLLGLHKIDIVTESYLAAIVFNDNFGLFPAKGEASKHVYAYQKAIMSGKVYECGDITINKAIERGKITMKSNGKLMYDDLLLLTLDLFEKFLLVHDKWKTKFDYIFGDENQDISYIQYIIIMRLISDKTNVTLVGDVKQTLYKFRGADYQYMDDFRKKYNATVFYLSETFRFGQKFADVSNKVIDQMKIDEIYKQKTLTNVQCYNMPSFMLLPDGHQINDIVTEIRNRREVFKYSDMNVIYRYNKEAIPVMKKLIQEGIPFELKSGDVFERSEIKFLIRTIALLRAYTIGDAIDLFKMYSNFIGDKTLTSMYHEVGSKDNVVKFIESCLSLKMSGIGPKKRESLEQMGIRLSNTGKYIADAEGKLNLNKVAKLMEMDATKFMVPYDNEEGGDDIATERWEYLAFFQENYNESKHVDPIEWYNDCLLNDQEKSEQKKDAVQLKTIHSCKGQSLPIVFFLANKMFNKIFIKTEEDIESEFFVLYVATTRAEKVMKVYHYAPGGTQMEFLFPVGASGGLMVPRQVVTEGKAQAIARGNLMMNKAKFRSRVNKAATLGFLTEKAVELKLGENKTWIPLSLIGYNGEYYFLQDWFVSKSNLQKFCI
jgi:DNA helicase-2/ATP-dependent DNA helicase PcrA